MADAIFEERRLAEIYDPLDPDRSDLDVYAALVFLTDEEWASTLRCVHAALRQGGRLIFETRDPEKQAWRIWDREHSYTRTDIPGVGAVETWVEVTGVKGELVSFRHTFVFGEDGAVLTSDSTLRFRHRGDVANSLGAAGFTVEEVRGAPDRPGRELVFIARRPD